MMARALNIAKMAYGSLRGFLIDARRYRELGFDERHLFWKRVQSWVFLAVMPVFLALGAASRAIWRRQP
jgi:hypothetical protein